MSYLMELIREKIAEDMILEKIAQQAIEDQVAEAAEATAPSVEDYINLYRMSPAEMLTPEVEEPGVSPLYPAIGATAGLGLGGLTGYLLARRMESPWMKALALLAPSIAGGIGGGLLGYELAPMPEATRLPILSRTGIEDMFTLSEELPPEEYPTYEDLFG